MRILLTKTKRKLSDTRFLRVRVSSNPIYKLTGIVRALKTKPAKVLSTTSNTLTN